MDSIKKTQQGIINICAHSVGRTGARNEKEEKACQDVFYVRETQNFLFFGLADGRSGSLYGAEGGHACLEAAADFVQKLGISEFIHYPFPDELPCMLMKEIRRVIRSMAKVNNSDRKEFASTLVAVAVDRLTGEYGLVHLGDGSVVGIRRNGTIVTLSSPENGVSRYHTWLTTSENAVPHLRVTFGSVLDKRRLLLMSDGAECFRVGNRIPGKRKKELLFNGTHQQIAEHLMDIHPVDDVGLWILDLSDDRFI